MPRNTDPSLDQHFKAKLLAKDMLDTIAKRKTTNAVNRKHASDAIFKDLVKIRETTDDDLRKELEATTLRDMHQMRQLFPSVPDAVNIPAVPNVVKMAHDHFEQLNLQLFNYMQGPRTDDLRRATLECMKDMEQQRDDKAEEANREKMARQQVESEIDELNGALLQETRAHGVTLGKLGHAEAQNKTLTEDKHKMAAGFQKEREAWAAETSAQEDLGLANQNLTLERDDATRTLQKEKEDRAREQGEWSSSKTDMQNRISDLLEENKRLLDASAKSVNAEEVDRRVQELSQKLLAANQQDLKLQGEIQELSAKVSQLTFDAEQAQTASTTLQKTHDLVKAGMNTNLKEERFRHQGTRERFNKLTSEHIGCSEVVRKLSNAELELEFVKTSLGAKETELKDARERLETGRSEALAEKKKFLDLQRKHYEDKQKVGTLKLDAAESRRQIGELESQKSSLATANQALEQTAAIESLKLVDALAEVDQQKQAREEDAGAARVESDSLRSTVRRQAGLLVLGSFSLTVASRRVTSVSRQLGNAQQNHQRNLTDVAVAAASKLKASSQSLLVAQQNSDTLRRALNAKTVRVAVAAFMLDVAARKLRASSQSLLIARQNSDTLRRVVSDKTARLLVVCFLLFRAAGKLSAGSQDLLVARQESNTLRREISDKHARMLIVCFLLLRAAGKLNVARQESSSLRQTVTTEHARLLVVCFLLLRATRKLSAANEEKRRMKQERDSFQTAAIRRRGDLLETRTQVSTLRDRMQDLNVQLENAKSKTRNQDAVITSLGVREQIAEHVNTGLTEEYGVEVMRALRGEEDVRVKSKLIDHIESQTSYEVDEDPIED